MSPSRSSAGVRATWLILVFFGVFAIILALFRHPALAEVVGGGVIIYFSVILSHHLTGRLAVEAEPGRQLVWNLLLALVILLALVGVGVMAAAIP